MSIRAVAWVLEESGLPLVQRAILNVYAYHADEHGASSWPSLSTVARESGAGRSTVCRVKAELEQTGYLSRCGTSPRGGPMYRLPMRSSSPRAGLVPERDEVVPERDSASPRAGPKPSLTVHEPSIERELFEFWRDATGRNGRTQFTPKRRARVRARVKDSTPDEIRTAITYVAGSQWHCDNGHTDLELICRSRDQIEKYVARAGAGPSDPRDDGW